METSQLTNLYMHVAQDKPVFFGRLFPFIERCEKQHQWTISSSSSVILTRRIFPMLTFFAYNYHVHNDNYNSDNDDTSRNNSSNNNTDKGCCLKEECNVNHTQSNISHIHSGRGVLVGVILNELVLVFTDESPAIGDGSEAEDSTTSYNKKLHRQNNYDTEVWWVSQILWETCFNGSHTLFCKVQSDRQTLALKWLIPALQVLLAILTKASVSHCEHSF